MNWMLRKTLRLVSRHHMLIELSLSKREYHHRRRHRIE